MKVTRRGFLGWTGAVAVAGVAGGDRIRALADVGAATYEAEVPPQGLEGWVASVCQQCPGGCGILVRTITAVEDGKKRAVKIEGNPHHPISRGTLCPKGGAGLQALYDPDRVTGPLKRNGPRGSGRWEPIGWDEAIASVAGRLRDLAALGEVERLRAHELDHALVALAVVHHVAHLAGGRESAAGALVRTGDRRPSGALQYNE